MPLDDYTTQQGGWDPHWFAYYKHNTSDVNQSILWACQVGHIQRSVAGGQTWQDVTDRIPDPPNAWDDAIAPTVADLTFLQRVDSIHQNKLHVFSAEWQEAGGDWRGWLLRTDDDGSLGSWTWEALGGIDTIDDGTFYYASAVADIFVNNDLTFHPAGSDNPCWFPNIASQSNMVGLQDGSYCVMDYVYNHHNGYGHAEVILDMGAVLTTGAGGYVEVYTKTPWSAATGLFWSTPICGVSTSPTGPWTAITTGTWWTAGPGWGTQQTCANKTFRYVRLRWLARWTAADHNDDAGIDAIRVADVTGIAAYAVRPVWMDVDSGAGAYLYLTLWREDAGGGALYLQQRLTADLSLVDEWSMGACLIGELGTDYIGYPFTPTFDADRIFCFGRLNAPAGLAGTQHVVRTVNGGAAWSSVENGWGGDVCGALRVEGDAARTMYAVRNIAAAAAEFYEGPEGAALAYRSDLPFAAGCGVSQDALTINNAGQVAVGANAASAVMVAIADPPHTVWSDVTDSFPGSEVRSLTYV